MVLWVCVWSCTLKQVLVRRQETEGGTPLLMKGSRILVRVGPELSVRQAISPHVLNSFFYISLVRIKDSGLMEYDCMCIGKRRGYQGLRNGYSDLLQSM